MRRRLLLPVERPPVAVHARYHAVEDARAQSAPLRGGVLRADKTGAHLSPLPGQTGCRRVQARVRGHGGGGVWMQIGVGQMRSRGEVDMVHA